MANKSGRTKQKRKAIQVIPDEIITRRIYLMRNQRVMLDFDLAALYEVETKRLNEQVKRNIDRFPKEFMFRLTKKEWQNMRSQIATSYPQQTGFERNTKGQPSSSLQKQRKTEYLPHAFTEHGVAMAANVLKSEKAVKMSVAIIKSFIQLRDHVLKHSKLVEMVKELRGRIGEHDVQLGQIYDTIENLLDEKFEKKRWEDRKQIGYIIGVKDETKKRDNG